MDAELQQAADQFIETLQNNDTIAQFRSAREAFDNDAELHELRSRYGALVEEFQQKQADGTLTQEDINELRGLQQKVNAHPTTTAMIQAQNDVQGVLGDCNAALSNTLGFDFAATAAPPAAC